MTYTNLEIELGFWVKESSSTSSEWKRFTQANRRTAIKMAERRLALDLDPSTIPDLLEDVSLSVESGNVVDLSYLTTPFLKAVEMTDAGDEVVYKDMEARVRPGWRYSFNNRSPFYYRLTQFRYQLKYPDSRTAAPSLKYIRYPQTWKEFRAGYLICGPAGTTNPVTWATLTGASLGEFAVSINGSAQSISSIDFAGVATMSDVAGVIQAALRVVGSGGFTLATCTWDSTNTRFIITSGSTSGATSVSVLSDAGTGDTDIEGSTYMNGESGTGIAVDGLQAFGWGTATTEFGDYEEELITYAAHYLLLQNGDEREAQALLKKYSALVGVENIEFADQEKDTRHAKAAS